MQPTQERDEHTANTLLLIIQQYAPDGLAQQSVVDVYALMVRDGVSKRNIVRNLAGILHNGFEYGNWPWN